MVDRRVFSTPVTVTAYHHARHILQCAESVIQYRSNRCTMTFKHMARKDTDKGYMCCDFFSYSSFRRPLQSIPMYITRHTFYRSTNTLPHSIYARKIQQKLRQAQEHSYSRAHGNVKCQISCPNATLMYDMDSKAFCHNVCFAFTLATAICNIHARRAVCATNTGAKVPLAAVLQHAILFNGGKTHRTHTKA